MKWRHSFVYILILALVGGYFYYFEVVQKAKKEAAEHEAKRMFHIEAGSVQAAEITQRGQGPVALDKKEQWLITRPVQSEVDKGAMDSFLETLVGLQSEVKVGEAIKDLKPYGLENPALKIRFEVSGQWMDLAVGDKNPVGHGYYAQTGDGTVYLIGESAWPVLNKGLNELRRRALFTFLPDQAKEVDVSWSDGTAYHLQRKDESAPWVAQENPKLKIKGSKVGNLLEQIQWLRAQEFVAGDGQNLAALGLDSPQVVVKIQLGGDKLAELKLGASGSEKDAKSLNAMSSELAGVMQVDSKVLKDIPKTVNDLEDRSLISMKSQDVKQVQWHFGDSSGSLTNLEGNKWHLKIGEGEVREPKESWRVNSFLWELQQAEFSKRIEPAPPKPEKPYAQIEIEGGGGKTTLTWEKLAAAASQPQQTTVWVEDNGQTECVEVGSEPLKKVEEEIHTLMASAEKKS